LTRWIVAFVLLASLTLAGATETGAAERGLSHDVYFTLKDNSEAARGKLLAACQKFLTGHEGTLFFSVGPLAPDLLRDVNDRDFDVALHVTFKDKAAHDKYQENPRHKQFIAENSDNWKKVRVFDSYVDIAPR
jgi:quinol monooxygenase YgiN